MERKLYRVTTSYFCAGVEVTNQVITGTAPILRWVQGQTLAYLISWIAKKGGTVTEVQVLE